jgi:hypothetical protein
MRTVISDAVSRSFRNLFPNPFVSRASEQFLRISSVTVGANSAALGRNAKEFGRRTLLDWYTAGRCERRGASGRRVVTIERTQKRTTLHSDEKLQPKFAEHVHESLDKLYQEFQSRGGEEE